MSKNLWEVPNGSPRNRIDNKHNRFYGWNPASSLCVLNLKVYKHPVKSITFHLKTQSAIRFVLTGCVLLPNSLTWQVDRLPKLCPINKQLMNSCDCCLEDINPLVWALTKQNCRNVNLSPIVWSREYKLEMCAVCTFSDGCLCLRNYTDVFVLLHPCCCSCNIWNCFYMLLHWLIMSHQHWF